ncbi:MAG: hypothetical protein AB7S78_05480 [Candidatus Omnitrophota bacterium]
MGVDQVGVRATPRLDLGAAIEEYVQDAGDFIGTRLFPIFKTPQKAANFSAITRESLTQTPDTKRAVNGKYNRGSIGAKDVGYSCEENGFEMPLDDSERRNYAKDFDAELAVSKAAMNIVLRGQETRIASIAMNTSIFTGAPLFTDVSGSNAWSDPTKDIIKTIRDAKVKIRTNCGLLPNTLVMSYTNLNLCLNNNAIKDAIKYTARPTDAEIINALKDFFGIPNVLIANAIKNSSKEGQAFSGSDIWSPTYVLLAVTAQDGQDPTQPSVGRTFLWANDSPENVMVEQYRDESIRSDVFRSRQHTDELVLDKYFGHLLKVV